MKDNVGVSDEITFTLTKAPPPAPKPEPPPQELTKPVNSTEK